MADYDDQSAFAPLTGVGPRLKAARESAGLSLAQVADQTKIPARMLILIEAGDFAALPARTYATGFTRSYARALGLDEKAMVASVRSELGMNEQVQPGLAQNFEPGDPARVPTARFAWLAAVAALAVVAAGMVLWRTYYAPAVVLPSLLPEEGASAAPPVPTAAAVPLPAVTVLPEATALPDEAASTAPAAPAMLSAPAPAPAPRRATTARRSPVSVEAPLEAAPAPAPASTAQN